MKTFKGRCYNCGDFGHKKEDCPKLNNQMNNNKSGRFNGTCFYCGKRGHIKSKCRKWEKGLQEMRSESAYIHQENENSDVVLMWHEEEVPICEGIFEYQDNKSGNEIEQDLVFFMNQTINKSIMNNNIWIVNSGASCHMPNLLEDMTNLKNSYSKIKVVRR